jgi:oligoribonuclease (3'-5' exoribonuclease)
MGSTFVWLDLETTGLDPKTRDVLAIGMVVTDERLKDPTGSV